MGKRVREVGLRNSPVVQIVFVLCFCVFSIRGGGVLAQETRGKKGGFRPGRDPAGGNSEGSCLGMESDCKAHPRVSIHLPQDSGIQFWELFQERLLGLVGGLKGEGSRIEYKTLVLGTVSSQRPNVLTPQMDRREAGGLVGQA